eukprot:IDg2486t1
MHMSDSFTRATESTCIGVGALEKRIVFDTVDKIIGDLLLFDAFASGCRLYTDCLVQRLPVAALVYSVHHHVLSAHKRELLVKMFGKDFRVENQA